MSGKSAEYWVPPVEGFFDEEWRTQVIVKSINEIINCWEDLQAGERRFIEDDTAEYLDSKSGSEYEFIVHPGYWMNAFEDRFEYFKRCGLDENDFDRPFFSHESYQDELQNTLINAQYQNRPIFALHPRDEPEEPWSERTRDFMENEIGIEEESYNMIPTVSANGVFLPDKGLKEFITILEGSPDFDARVSGEFHGRCTAQLEMIFAVLNDITGYFDFDVLNGPKFPGIPLKFNNEVAKPSEAYAPEARFKYEEFLITELPENLDVDSYNIPYEIALSPETDLHARPRFLDLNSREVIDYFEIEEDLERGAYMISDE